MRTLLAILLIVLGVVLLANLCAYAPEYVP
jgi:ABC-type antimicrobial peptide transport system permease subunit